jgi:hypothetical protein
MFPQKDNTIKKLLGVPVWGDQDNKKLVKNLEIIIIG